MVKSHPNELVLIAVRVHLFPSRTQKLSSQAPTILGGRLPGKIGNANIRNSPSDRMGSFRYAKAKSIVKKGQHRTIVSASLSRLFAPLLQLEKPEIHTVFLRFGDFELRQKSWLRLLAELGSVALREETIP